MLPPYELKNKKKFPVVLRGYAQTEVDEHIEYLIERYTELYRKNDELERQIRLLTSKLDELEAKEDAINRAIVGAQKLKERIISEAEAEAELITSTAKKSASRIIGGFENKIYHEKATLHAMMEQVSQFKEQMLAEYEKQMELISLLAPEEADPEYDREDSEYVARIMNDIRQAADEATSRQTAEDDPFTEGMGEGEFAPVEEPERARRPMRAKRVPGLSSKLAKVIKEETGEEINEPQKEQTEDETDQTLKELFGENK